MATPINRRGPHYFGGTMWLGQQDIRQSGETVNAQFGPFNSSAATPTMEMGYESIPNGCVVFLKKEPHPGKSTRAQKRRKIVETSGRGRHRYGTASQPMVFANLKHVAHISQVTVAGISDTMLELVGDDWRNRSGRSVIVCRGGKRTTMNGPEDCYPGDYVVWFPPALDAEDNIRVQAGGEPCHHAILRPLTKENYDKDPLCIDRVVGMCTEFSRANTHLNLDVRLCTTNPPFGCKREDYEKAKRDSETKLEALEAAVRSGAVAADAKTTEDEKAFIAGGGRTAHHGSHFPQMTERELQRRLQPRRSDDTSSEQSATLRPPRAALLGKRGPSGPAEEVDKSDDEEDEDAEDASSTGSQ